MMLEEKKVIVTGGIDGLVYCAIQLVPGRIEELPEEDWDRVMDIGLKGYFLCAQAAGRVMLDQGSGAIVFVSSIGGMQTYPLVGAYSIFKSGRSCSASSSASSGRRTACAPTPSRPARSARP